LFSTSDVNIASFAGSSNNPRVSSYRYSAANIKIKPERLKWENSFSLMRDMQRIVLNNGVEMLIRD
jgi:hypothetical protein